MVNGKRSVTANTALRLERYFNVEAQFLLNLQTEYDLRLVKRKIWTDIEQRIITFETTQTGTGHHTVGTTAVSGMLIHLLIAFPYSGGTMAPPRMPGIMVGMAPHQRSLSISPSIKT